jgi:hypothetical protein
MKARSIFVALSMMLAASAWADEPKTDAAAPADASAPMNMSAPADTAAPAATELPAADAAPGQYQKMDENLDRMHALVGQMKDATDPAARQKLMLEYMSAQHENMMLARAMGMAPGMMGMGPGMGIGPGMGLAGHHGGGDKCDMARMGKRDRDFDDMHGMGKMGKRDCDMDDMHCQCHRMDMGKMDRQDCDMDGMRGMRGMGMMGDGMGMGHGMGMMGGPGMGMMGGGMGPGMGGMGMGRGMGMMGAMDGMRDEAMAARMQSLEKRLDALQEMMKMMMNR